MNLETRWSAPALQSLAEVLQYTLDEHGEGQYNKLRRQVMDAVRRIAQSPFSAVVEPISEKSVLSFADIKSFRGLRLSIRSLTIRSI